MVQVFNQLKVFISFVFLKLLNLVESDMKSFLRTLELRYVHSCELLLVKSSAVPSENTMRAASVYFMQ